MVLKRRVVLICILSLVLLSIGPLSAGALDPANSAFLTVWQRSDLPVSLHEARRSWIWGNGAMTQQLIESYEDAPGGVRVVQYYDKARMEITNPDADPTSPWYVTTGLLTRELITGTLHLGDNAFRETEEPAAIPIAGDPENTFPTYADLRGWIDQPAPDRTGQPVTVALAPEGQSSYTGATQDPRAHNVQYVTYTGSTGEPVGYNMPRAFWEFLTQSGIVYEGGEFREADPLFDWHFVLGWPISEPFWSNVLLNGQPTWVMVQPFERRVLTYTPTNPEGWKVEMGNIGQHYYRWRYHTLRDVPTPTTVLVSDFYFYPRTLTVPAGTTVVWWHTGERAHTVTFDDGSWESGDLQLSEVVARRFDQPGTYWYHCRYYEWMTAKIVVEEPG